MINNNEIAKLQELIEKEKEDKERAERIIRENRSHESDGWDEKEIEQAKVESMLTESERISKIAIEKENVEKDFLYARMLQENFDRSDELNRKAQQLQEMESKLLSKQRDLETSSENQRPIRRRRPYSMVFGENKNVLGKDRAHRNMTQREQAQRHRIENERAHKATLERESAYQNRIENEKARRRMEETKIQTAHLAEQRRLEQQRFQNSQMNMKKPDSWLDVGLMVLKTLKNIDNL